MTTCSTGAALPMAAHDIISNSHTTPPAERASPLEDFSYGDVRPMLSADPNSQALALVHIANLAGSRRSLTIAQASDAIITAVELIDLDSPRRSESNVVRLEAIVALRAIALNPSLLRAVPDSVREHAFSVLACLPSARFFLRESLGCLGSEVSVGPRETDAGVRAMCESVAGLFSKNHLAGVTPLVEREFDPLLPWPAPATTNP